MTYEKGKHSRSLNTLVIEFVAESMDSDMQDGPRIVKLLRKRTTSKGQPFVPECREALHWLMKHEPDAEHTRALIGEFGRCDIKIEKPKRGMVKFSKSEAVARALEYYAQHMKQ